MKLIQSKLFNSVQNTMLVIIAFCLCLIVVKLYTPNAYADEDLRDYYLNRIADDVSKIRKILD